MYSVGIIGAGNIGAGFDSPNSPQILTHAHAVFSSACFNLRGFFDVEKWGCRCYDSIEELAGGSDVCVCCVPDRFHKSIIENLVDHKPKLIIAEKPLASTVDEGLELYKLCFGRVPIAVDYSRRFIPEFQEIQRKLPSYGSFLKGVAYYGKGTYHNGSHMIDLLRFFFGEIEEVRKTGVEVHDFDYDTTCDAILHINGSNVYLMGIDSRSVTVFEMDLMFEKARIRILNGGQVIESYSVAESENFSGYRNYKLFDTVFVDYSSALIGLYDNVYGFLNNKEKLLCDLEDGLNVLKICEKVRSK